MNKKEININEIFKGTIAVHLTDYFPKKKRIRTRFYVDARKWFRDTIHFTLNGPVRDLPELQTPNLKEATWSNKKFCILIPFDKLYELNGKNLQGFGPNDTFFTRSIILPDNTIILVMPLGINDLINNGITSNEEVSSQLSTKKSKFFEKSFDSIIYRIFNPNLQWEITKITTETIIEKGYSPEFFYDKSIREISDALGLEFVAHYMHWTSNLEDFLNSIYANKEQVDNILSVLVKTSKQGIIFPFEEDAGGSGNFVDSEGTRFRFIKIIGLTNEERHAAECLEWSLLPIGNRSNLQFPMEYAKTLLNYEKIPNNYHNAIKFYIKDYQIYIKEKLPRAVIILCPKLSELLDEKF